MLFFPYCWSATKVFLLLIVDLDLNGHNLFPFLNKRVNSIDRLIHMIWMAIEWSITCTLLPYLNVRVHSIDYG